MPAITDPNEPYFKDGIWGWAATLWQRLISEGGRLFTALHGWDGAAWHRLPMVWGYSDIYAEAHGADNVGVGTYTHNFSVVPAGEVWVVTRVTAYSAQTDPTFVEIIASIDAAVATLYFKAHPLAYDTHHVETDTILNQDDFIRVNWYSCLAATSVYASVVGYKMLIAE